MKHKLSSVAKVVTSFALLATFIPVGSTYATTEEETAVESVINSLRTIYQTQINEYNAANTDLQLKVVDSNVKWARYKPSTVNAYLGLYQSYGLEVMTIDDISASLLDPRPIADKLVSLGFSEYGHVYYWPPTTQYINEDTGVLCSVTVGFSSCGHINWVVTVTDEWQKYINGIGSAYHAKFGVYPVLTSADIYSDEVLPPTIHNSEYKPYQYTEVSIDNGHGLFYRSSPTSEWVHFRETQALLECSEFTGEAQKGFAGYVCYNGQEKSTVKVATSTPTSTSEETSSVAVPNTGAITNDDKNVVATTIITIIAVISGLIAYGIHYTKTRLASRVGFKK